MIDHMLVNLKKYYEGKFRCYIGMNIKAPKSSLPAYYMADSPVDGADMLPSTAKPSLTPAELENKEVIAQRLNGLDDFYLLIQPAGYYSYINCWIKLSDLVKNGGVSASLTHVCHALSLVRKVLSMAIEKMKFQLKDWYEGTQPYYVGQTIKGVKSNLANFTLTSTAESIYFDTYYWKNHYDVSTLSASQVNGQKVLYQVTSTANYLHAPNPRQVFLGFILKHIYDRSRDQYDDVMCWVKLNDILQNGGVSSSPLTHLYQGLRHLLDRKVVPA